MPTSGSYMLETGGEERKQGHPFLNYLKNTNTLYPKLHEWYMI